jgi:hypothetical protein
VAASLPVVLVLRSGVEPVSGVRELGFGEGHPAALASVKVIPQLLQLCILSFLSQTSSPPHSVQ